jgi:hypothetical protein
MTNDAWKPAPRSDTDLDLTHDDEVAHAEYARESRVLTGGCVVLLVGFAAVPLYLGVLPAGQIAIGFVVGVAICATASRAIRGSLLKRGNPRQQSRYSHDMAVCAAVMSLSVILAMSATPHPGYNVVQPWRAWTDVFWGCWWGTAVFVVARYGGRGAWGIALVGGMVGFSVGIVAFWS